MERAQRHLKWARVFNPGCQCKPCSAQRSEDLAANKWRRWYMQEEV